MIEPPPSRLTLRLDADFGALAGMREALRRWMQEARTPGPAVEETLLVATELCANAVEATPEGEAVSLEAARDGRELSLAVSNRRGPAPGRPRPSMDHGSLQERGRGLAIVAALVDRLTATTDDGRTVVRVRRCLW
jgi:serine/threonine-protein kinase RsbW